MEYQFETNSVENVTAKSLVLFVDQFEKVSNHRLRDIDKASNGSVTALFDSGEFSGKINETATILKPIGYNCDRIILVGLGERKNRTADSFRKAAGTVSRDIGLNASSRVAFCMEKTADKTFFQAAIEGFLLGRFKINKYKSKSKEKEKIKKLLFVTDKARIKKNMTAAVERGIIIAEGQNGVRDLSSAPSNFLTPRDLANKAAALAKEYKFSCKIMDEKEIAREKMGALLSVAKGSDEPPRFIVLHYKGAAAKVKHIVLVGKGVTFDTGGISIKASLNMHEMKGDMTGSAVVLMSLVTAARLKLPLNIVVLIPSTENMPSAKATKPGDICTSRKGLTIENINTDAEGRLILADALDYANKFKPQAVIDVATLTGATLFSLGYEGAPIFGNNPNLMNKIKKASARTSERVWEFPIWQEYRDAMKSSIADLRNSGSRDAGTCKAAAFLEYFIGDYNWAHIDIAYVDIEINGRPYIPKGATGIGMRMLVDMLINWKK